MSIELFVWWFLLCTVSLVNVLGLSLSAPALKRRHPLLPPDVYATRRLQFILSAGYVLGCAYRSALPVYDVQRLCLFDSWMSSVIVGRTVATIAELCFVTQWALLLHETAHAADSRIGKAVAWMIVPMIVVAETFSWYSVLTTSNIGHVVEESLWGTSAALLVLGLVSIWPRSTRALRPYLLACGVMAVAYVGFMFMVDVPMYWSRWVADEASGRHYLGVLQGIADASGRWVVSHRWQDWQSEIAWMTLYFSVAVWFSIALIHAPFLDRTALARARQGS
nr:hypothetical protein [Rhodoferax sp.]